jgi:hypothetical protein
MINTLKCIREVKTKSGLTFKKNKSYSYTISKNLIRVYITNDKSVVIRNEKTLNKYFK